RDLIVTGVQTCALPISSAEGQRKRKGTAPARGASRAALPFHGSDGWYRYIPTPAAGRTVSPLFRSSVKLLRFTPLVRRRRRRERSEERRVGKECGWRGW